MLKNKSILLPVEASDGWRICVMNSIHDDYQFDLWYQVLAPSRPLIEAYIINKTMSWPDFSQAYREELKNKTAHVHGLIALLEQGLALGVNITLLCSEEDYRGCHREILWQEIFKLCPSLKQFFWTEEK